MFHALKMRRGYRVTFILVSVIAALLVVGVALAAAVPIDSFNADTVVATASNTTPDVISYTLSSEALGGQRDLRAVYNTGAAVKIAVNDGAPASQAAAYSTDSATNGYATITWDGQTDPAALNFGLTANLQSSSPPNTMFRMRITNNDLPVLLTIRAYTTDANHYSEYSTTTQGGISSGAVDLLFLFTSPTATGPSGPADFTNINAIVLTIDNRLTDSENADLTLDQFDVLPGEGDYGDLPNVYGNAITTTYHLRPTLLRLGTSVDSEIDGQPSDNADGDNNLDLNDEQGIIRTPAWKWRSGTPTTNGGRINVTIGGCDNFTTDCYLYGWIDFNQDNVLDASEEIIVDSNLHEIVPGNGTFQYRFTIPGTAGTPLTGSYYARFRICGGAGGANDCSSPTGASTSGEIEDYVWNFGPLAVTLESLQAQPVNTSPLLPLALVGGAAVILIGAVLFTRKSRKHTV